jgi:hypothetical protein
MIRKTLTLSSFLNVILVLAACAKAQPTTPPVDPLLLASTQVTLPASTEAPIATQTENPPVPTLVQTESPSSGESRPYYELKAEIDHAARTAAVEEVVHYTNLTDREMAELLFIAEPNRYSNGFKLISVDAPGGQVALDYSLESNRLTVRLNPGLPPGDRIQLAFQYELVLPAIPPPSDMLKPQPYGYTDHQLNLVDWYLFIAPLAENGEWLAHKPSYFGEFLVYPAADYWVEVNLVNAPADLLVAASAENQSIELGKYRYELQAARTFALSLNSGYESAETRIRGVTVRSYFAGFDRAAGEAALAATTAALDLYSDLFGEYPRQSLSVVEADFLDGMEFDGLYFLSKAFYNLYDGTQKGYLTFIAVHETAHQWFFGQVGNDQALEPWLDEAWCTFSELLYYEHYFPELVDWWWYYRVKFYEPVGFIDQPVYEYPGFTAYRNAVYLRGAQFLNELRAAQGEEEFFMRTKAYLSKYSGKISTAKGFFEEFGLLSENDQDLITRYFRSVE